MERKSAFRTNYANTRGRGEKSEALIISPRKVTQKGPDSTSSSASLVVILHLDVFRSIASVVGGLTTRSEEIDPALSKFYLEQI